MFSPTSGGSGDLQDLGELPRDQATNFCVLLCVIVILFLSVCLTIFSLSCAGPSVNPKF